MAGALIVIAVVAGLLLALLAVPVSVAFRLEGIEAFNGQFTIGWLFGLLRFRFRLPNAGRRRTRAARARVTGKRGGAAGKAVAALRQAPFRRRVFRLLKDLLRAAHLHELRLRLRLGLGDPADTGRLWAIIGPLNAAAQNLRHADVQIEPEFIDPAFEFRADGRLLLIPLQFLLLAIAFVLSPASIRAWRRLKDGHA